MKNNLALLILCTLIAFTTSSCLRGCGPDKEKDEEPSSEYESGGGLSAAVKNMEKAVKNLEESINEPQEPINFREFKSNLKEKLDGMKRVSFNGETSGFKGLKASSATAKYESGDKYLTIEMIDVGGVAFAVLAVAAWSGYSVDKESDNYTERTGTYRGHKTYEKYFHNRESGEFKAVLYDRFVVNMKGRGMKEADFKDVFDDMRTSNLKKYKPKKKEE